MLINAKRGLVGGSKSRPVSYNSMFFCWWSCCTKIVHTPDTRSGRVVYPFQPARTSAQTLGRVLAALLRPGKAQQTGGREGGGGSMRTPPQAKFHIPAHCMYIRSNLSKFQASRYTSRATKRRIARAAFAEIRHKFNRTFAPPIHSPAPLLASYFRV